MGYSKDRARGAKGVDTPDLSEGFGERKYSKQRGAKAGSRKYSEEVARGDHAPPLSRRPSGEWSKKYSLIRQDGGDDTPPLYRKSEDWNYSRKRSSMPIGKNDGGDLFSGSEGPSKAARAAKKAACRK